MIFDSYGNQSKRESDGKSSTIHFAKSAFSEDFYIHAEYFYAFVSVSHDDLPDLNIKFHESEEKLSPDVRHEKYISRILGLKNVFIS